VTVTLISIQILFLKRGEEIDLIRHHGIHRPFDDPERRKWQEPDAILKEIGLKPGSTFADIGCGGGFFALPAARMVGESGKVYGVDANAGAIASLKVQANSEGLKNLSLSVGKAEEIIPCCRCADIVFFGIVLHDFRDPARVLKNARETAKPNGKLVNLDWKKDAAIGPPVPWRFAVEKAVRLIRDAGFFIEETRDSGLYHYLVIARPG
jgi:ubiquinone/menaquinone biosynthesis C-methylase UbiE